MHQLARQPHRRDQHAPVAFFREIIGLDDGRGEWIGGSGADKTLALRPVLPGGNRETRVIVKLTMLAVFKARRRKNELNIVGFGAGIRVPEAVHQRRRQIEDALGADEVLDHFANKKSAPASAH